MLSISTIVPAGQLTHTSGPQFITSDIVKYVHYHFSPALVELLPFHMYMDDNFSHSSAISTDSSL